MTAEEQRKQELDDIRKVMKTYYGRRLLWRLLNMTGVFDTPWTPCHATLSMLAGKRIVGSSIESDIREVDVDGYTLMAKEAQTRNEAVKKENDDE